MAYGPDDYGVDRDDVLDVGADRPPPRPWLTPVLFALLAIGAGTLVVTHSGTKGDGQPGPPPLPPPPPVSVRSLGHRLLGVRAGWELFARGDHAMVAIDLAAGRITTTQVPVLESNSREVAFIVTAHEAIIRSFDEVPGYVVPDGRAPQRLSGTLAKDEPGPLLPGPRPGQTWVFAGNGRSSSLQLIGPDGRPTGTSARLPPGDPNPATAVPDGRGNALLLTTSNLTYDASATRYWQVRATVLAVGPVAWLGFRCHGLTCHNVVINAATGVQHTLGTGRYPIVPAFAWPSLGATSPDGRYAVVSSTGMNTVLRLVNLITGAIIQVSVLISPSPGYQDMVWSPDSRWLFVTTADGALIAVNPRTGTATALDLSLPPLSQLAIRPAAVTPS